MRNYVNFSTWSKHNIIVAYMTLIIVITDINYCDYRNNEIAITLILIYVSWKWWNYGKLLAKMLKRNSKSMKFWVGGEITDSYKQSSVA